jgi:hypothetical protein
MGTSLKISIKTNSYDNSTKVPLTAAAAARGCEKLPATAMPHKQNIPEE